jgi:hypothetical protein
MSETQDEWEEPEVCADCGAEIWPVDARAFAVGPDVYLCFECAERRGGVYDADKDRWTVPPDASRIADERRPHL